MLIVVVQVASVILTCQYPQRLEPLTRKSRLDVGKHGFSALYCLYKKY
jgi:hypothetical protein